MILSFREVSQAQLQHRLGGSEIVENLQYYLESTIARRLRAQEIMEYRQSPLDTVRATVDCYRRRLPNFTKRLRTVIMYGFCGYRF